VNESSHHLDLQQFQQTFTQQILDRLLKYLQITGKFVSDDTCRLQKLLLGVGE